MKYRPYCIIGIGFLSLFFISCNNSISYDIPETTELPNSMEIISETASDGVTEKLEEISEIIEDDNEYLPGSELYFGKYEQDGDTAEMEDITWIILENKDGTILALSKYILDVQPFCSQYGERIEEYENSSIRAWLNDFFCENAFSEEEMEKLVPASEDDLEILSGENTYSDIVFLLDNTEINNYLKTPESRKSIKTRYARNVDSSDCWWLRSSSKWEYADCVSPNGKIGKDGAYAQDTLGVRPAIMLKVE